MPMGARKQTSNEMTNEADQPNDSLGPSQVAQMSHADMRWAAAFSSASSGASSGALGWQASEVVNVQNMSSNEADVAQTSDPDESACPGTPPVQRDDTEDMDVEDEIAVDEVQGEGVRGNEVSENAGEAAADPPAADVVPDADAVDETVAIDGPPNAEDAIPDIDDNERAGTTQLSMGDGSMEEAPDSSYVPSSQEGLSHSPEHSASLEAESALDSAPATKPRKRFAAPRAPQSSSAAAASAPRTKAKSRIVVSESEGTAEQDPMACSEDQSGGGLSEPSSTRPKSSSKTGKKGKSSVGGAKATDKAAKGPKAKSGKRPEAPGLVGITKAKKDKNAPKRAASAYQLWSTEARKDEQFSAYAFADASKALGAAWKAMEEGEKAPWDAKAKEDKVRYAEEMEHYRTNVESSGGSSSGSRKSKGSEKKKAAAPRKVLRAADSSDDDMMDAGDVSDMDMDADDVMEELPMVDGSPMPRGSSVVPRIDPTKIAKPEQLPLMSACSFEPRALIPMRKDAWKVGDDVVWVPQCFLSFLDAHADIMEQVRSHLGERLPATESRLMRKPADGTAHAARIEAIETSDDVPGLLFLHLKATTALSSVSSRRRAATDSGVESGADSAMSDADGNAGEGEDAAGATYYSIPVIDRKHCDTDQHAMRLDHYTSSLQRIASSTQFVVPFAASSDAATQKRPMEVLWEGRAFDQGLVHDLTNYPRSTYKSLHCVWYRALKQDKRNPKMMQWCFDEEQTDNNQSPWDTMPSSHHAKWRSAFPTMAALLKPRTKRGIFGTNAVVEAPESMEIEGGDGSSEDTIVRVLKRLTSNEAASYFFHSVPKAEKAYHAKIERPICLDEILGRAERGEYAHFSEFHADVEHLVSNAFLFHPEDSDGFILACMMQKEINDYTEAIRQAGFHELLSTPADVADLDE